MHRIIVFILLLMSSVNAAELKPLIAATCTGCVLTLSTATVYDDLEPIRLDRDMKIEGPASAVVHSEFMIVNATNIAFRGFTLVMNKVGAPSHTGNPMPYPQNGMVTIVNAMFWSDDQQWSAVAGLPAKSAIHGINSWVAVRSMTVAASIDWRHNVAQVIEIYYGGSLITFDNTTYYLGLPLTATLGLSIIAGTDEAHGAAIALVMGAKYVTSGGNVYNFGTALYGVSLARGSSGQIGAGIYTVISGFAIPSYLDGTELESQGAYPSEYSRRTSSGSYIIVAPGCWG